MSRYCVNHNSDQVLAAAERWKRECIVRDGSLLSDEPLWTREHLRELEEYFIDNPDEGGGTFLKKLEAQLEPASAGAKRLASEMLWLILACPSNISPGTKRQQIRAVWNWGGTSLPTDHHLLSDKTLEGVGSGGQGINQYRWRELVFVVRLAQALKSESPEKRQQLIEDEADFSRFIESVPESETRQMRHIVLFLLFPDTHERIFSRGDKQRIVVAFTGKKTAEVGKMTVTEIDAELLQIRRAKARELDSERIDFYEPPLKAVWQGQKTEPAKDTENVLEAFRQLTHADIEQAISEFTAGAGTQFRDSTGYDLIHEHRHYPPKAIAGVAAGNILGREVAPSEFSGGVGSPCFRMLDRLGFSVVEKGAQAILLTWDPTKWTWETYVDDVKRIQSGQNPACTWWSTGRRREISAGTRFFLMKLGTEPKGIIGSGWTSSEPYESQHSDPAKETSQRVDLKWEALLDIETESPLEVTDLPEDELPSYQWLPQQSGNEIPAPVSAKLESLWKGHVGALREKEPLRYPPFALSDAMEGIFLDQSEVEEMHDALSSEKNIVLQGPPGTGKTYLARRIAFLLLGHQDPRRLMTVQFHPGYSYEDFVLGYRPADGGFQLSPGVFLEFCQAADRDPDQPYVLMIDELNRGNVAAIFGELMMLIEPDKRGVTFAMPLTYRDKRLGSDRFYVPPNVHVIGTMNTADRSLAMVDYALRRRFRFFNMTPRFNAVFREFFVEQGGELWLAEAICSRLDKLNREILEDETNLGAGFEIGHSYFCPKEGADPNEDWYNAIIRGNIAPLLHEYWFEDSGRVEKAIQELLI